MDERQTKIREGAGLEESRINEDFKQFIGVWGPRMLMAVGIVGLAWWGWRYLGDQRRLRVDTAFDRYSVLDPMNGDPRSFLEVAQEFEGVRAVPSLARLDAARLYMRAASTGIRVGAVFSPTTGELESADDILPDDEKQRYVSLARELYERVLADNEKKHGSTIHVIAALHGLAAVAEHEGDFERATSLYQRIESLATESDYEAHAVIARSMSSSLHTIAGEPRLLSTADLPERPRPELEAPLTMPELEFNPQPFGPIPDESGQPELPSILPDPIPDPSNPG